MTHKKPAQFLSLTNWKFHLHVPLRLTISKFKLLNVDCFIVAGCDWLHEISITVRATREVSNITNERLQRLAMLESNTLLKNLFAIATNNGEPLMQSLAIDILIWVLSIRLARYRCPRNHASTDVNAQQSYCVNIVEQNLSDLIGKCILLNNRSIAHKCVKLVIATMHGAQNIVDQKQYFSFEVALKNSVLSAIPDVVKANHAGAVRWFTMLISATSNVESHSIISTALIKLLIEVLNEISARPNAMNSILQSRFGLYGMPFESELFDAELPSMGRNSNVSYCNVFYTKSGTTTINGQQQQQQNQFSDLKNFCASGKRCLSGPNCNPFLTIISRFQMGQSCEFQFSYDAKASAITSKVCWKWSPFTTLVAQHQKPPESRTWTRCRFKPRTSSTTL